MVEKAVRREKRFNRTDILGQLTLIELFVVDEEYWGHYLNALAQAASPAERIKLNIDMIAKVAKLRDQGRMQKPEVLRPIANEMVALPPSELKAALQRFYQEQISLPK